MKGKWTRAKVRHKTPKWYWVRNADGRGSELARIHAARRGFVCVPRLASGNWGHPHIERWSHPIEEPK